MIEIVGTIVKITVSLGRYLLYPLLFFGVAVGAYRLRQDEIVLKTLGSAMVLLVGFSILFVLLGMAAILLLGSFRIPIIIAQGVHLDILGGMELFDSIFPLNSFMAFSGSGNFVLPIVVFGFLIGFAMPEGTSGSKQLRELLETLSQLFGRCNKVASEFMVIGTVPFSTYILLQLRSVPAIELFVQFLVAIALIVLIITFGVLPLILFTLTQRRLNPYLYLYGVLPAALVGLVSGDNYISTTMLLRTSHSNLGVPSRIGSITYPIFAIFGKAGTALVAAGAFLVVINSYSSLGITIGGIISVALFALLVSFATGNYPALGLPAGLALMCRLYGQGLEEGFLILIPIMPILTGCAVFLNTLVSATASLLVAEHTNTRKATSVASHV